MDRKETGMNIGKQAFVGPRSFLDLNLFFIYVIILHIDNTGYVHELVREMAFAEQL